MRKDPESLSRYTNSILRHVGVMAILNRKGFEKLVKVVLRNAYLDGRVDQAKKDL